jgi:flagellar biosynthesis protein FlhF
MEKSDVSDNSFNVLKNKDISKEKTMSKNEDEKLLTVDDVRALREEISLMHGSLAQNVLTHTPLIQTIAERFIRAGLDRRWTEKLLAPLAGSAFEDDEELLIAYVLEELDSLLDIEEEKEEVSKKVHLLVGTTGIGKSSLIGKLAARYTYMLPTPHKVAFINLDTQKVGAYEQLENYAEAMEIPLLGLEALIDNTYDTIFVDTAGNLGEHLQELEEFVNFVEGKTIYDVEISLVISATAKARDLEKVHQAFSLLPINNYMVTKLDETYDISDLINFLIQHRKPIRYLSMGQRIPEDLSVPSKEYLLEQFMQDF